MADNQDENIINEILSYVKTARSDLLTDDLFRRKKILQELNKKLFTNSATFSKDTYKKAFEDCHLQVLRCFRDKSEMCRELAIELMSNFVHNLELNDYYLTYIFPVLVERIGSAELIEESEELRLELVNFMIDIVKIYGKTEHLVPFLNDIVKILQETAVDKYPKVKEASCKCIIELAEALPKHFHLQCESLVKPVLQSFSHQHFRVRVIAIRAIGVIVMHSTNCKILDTTVGPLAERLFDQTALVRRTVIQVTALFLTEYRDRYSFFHRFLPLILTGLCDEVPETRLETEKLWAEVGMQYQNENEKDMKDQIDFLYENLPNYPTELKRPNLGCRTLVQRNVSKILVPLCVELKSWQDDIRIRCAQLLCTIVLHCEEFLTQSLQDVLMTMYTTCMDQDKRVNENVMQAARLVGMFIPVNTWWKLLLPVVLDTTTYGHLRILRCIATGTAPTELETIALEVADLLAKESIRCGSRRPLYQKELVECCRVLLPFSKVSTQLFVTLVTVVALCLTTDTTPADMARELVKEIPKPEDHVIVLLQQFGHENISLISAVSSDRHIFDTLLCEWSSALVPHLSLVTPKLVEALAEGSEPDACLKTYTALSTFLREENIENIISNGKQDDILLFVQLLIKDVLLPSLIWRAGRTAEALRIAAAFCMYQTLHHIPSLPAINETKNEAPFAHLLSTLLALLEDAAWRTRVYACKSLTDIGRLLTDNEVFKKRWANESAVQLVKKVDDPINAVRMEAFSTLKQILSTPNLLEIQNLRYLVDAVLMQLDDQDSATRQAAIDILQKVGLGDATYLMEKLRTDKHMFKNEDLCDDLIKYVNSLNTF